MRQKSLYGAMLRVFVGVLLLWNGVADARPVLNVSFSLSESEWTFFREEILPAFEKAHDCEVKASQVDASDLPKLLAAGKMAGRSLVDIFAQDNMQLAVLIKEGLVEDLSALRERIPAEVYPSMIEACTFDGTLYFIPFRPNVQIFYYNREKFDEYGLNPPQSWEEWLGAAKLFKEKEGVGRVLIKGFGGAVTVTQMYEYIVAAGGDPMTFNDEGCVRTFGFFRELWQHASPDSRRAKYDTSNDYLARDSVYLMQNWPFGYKILTEDYGKKNVEVYSGFPGPVRRAHVIGGDVFGIPVGTPNRELALAFVEYMLSREVQSAFVKGLAWPSVRQDAYAGVDSPVFVAVNEALSHGIFRANVPYWTEYQKLFEEAFFSIVVRGGDVRSELDAYAQRLDGIRARYR